MKITAVIKNTFKEGVKSKLFVMLFVFSIFFIFFSRIISMLVVADEIKVLKDLGLSIIEVFSILTSVLIGVNFFYKERDKKTIYNILSKPVTREEFLVGKFFGISFILLTSIIFLSAVFHLYLFIVSGKFHFYLLPQEFLFFLEGNILIAFSFLFGSFSTPILSSIFTIGLFFAGKLTDTVKFYYERVAKGVWKVIAEAVYYIIPNLKLLDYKNTIVYEIKIPLDSFLIFSLYAITYTFAVLIIAVIIFKNKEIQ